MPVYERGYKHWQPSERKAVPPWWVIARRGIAGRFEALPQFVELLFAALMHADGFVHTQT